MADRNSDSASEGSTVMGQVSAIGEDSITLSVMTKPQGAKPSGNPSNNKDFSDRPEGTPPAMKEGEERPVSGGAFHGGEGRAASDGAIRNGGKGESKTIKISDSTTVNISQGESTTEGSISDISLGKMVEVVLESDGETAKLVTIMNIERGSKSMKSSN